MLTIKFHDQADDSLLEFGIIVSRYNGQWVFCKHRERETYECPGGHREPGEPILETARRELYEETGALDYELRQVGPYSATDGREEHFAMLYYAEIERFGDLPEFEIERVELFRELPERWTYPEIQPVLVEHVCQLLLRKDSEPSAQA